MLTIELKYALVLMEKEKQKYHIKHFIARVCRFKLVVTNQTQNRKTENAKDLPFITDGFTEAILVFISNQKVLEMLFA